MTDKIVLPRLNIAVISAPDHAHIHIRQLRLRLGIQHHFCCLRYAQHLGRPFDLAVLVDDPEFGRLPVRERVKLVTDTDKRSPCRLVTRDVGFELLVAIKRLPRTERWAFWPNKDEALADIADLIGLEPLSAPH